MTYTGKVQPGGPADVRELPGLDDLQDQRRADGQRRLPAALPGRPTSSCSSTPPTSRTGCSTWSARTGWSASSPPTGTPTTGRRWPTWSKATGARTFAHPLDAPGIPVETDVFLDDGDRVRFGAVELTVDPPGRPHARQRRPGVRRPGGRPAPVHRRLPVPRRGRPHRPAPRTSASLFDGRRGQALRRAAGRDVGLPGPRRRHHARGRAAAPGRVGGPRLVDGRERQCPTCGSDTHPTTR